jgi:ferredoxin
VSGPDILRRDGEAATWLRVDPTACDGIGMCAHLAPGVIGTDSWGYPVLTGQPIHGTQARRAAAAVAACPRRALFIEVPRS